MKRILKKLFTAMNWIVGIIFLVSASAVDEVSWFQIMVCALSLAYLGCALYISKNIDVLTKKG